MSEYAYRINPDDWADTYAPRGAERRCVRGMRWYRDPVHIRSITPRYRKLQARVGVKRFASVWGVWGKIKELAASNPERLRPWILNHSYEPATVDDIAFAALMEPSQVRYAIEALCAEGWIERVPIDQWRDIAEGRAPMTTRTPITFNAGTFVLRLCEALELHNTVALKNARAFQSLTRQITETPDPDRMAHELLDIARGKAEAHRRVPFANLVAVFQKEATKVLANEDETK